MVTGHLYAELTLIRVNAVAQGCCHLVWHSSTEQQGRHSTLNTAALVYGDCTLVCRVDLDRGNCSGTRLLSAGLAQQHRRTSRHFTLNTAGVHWCMVTAHFYAELILIGVNAVAQACCQLVWHSSTEEQAGTLP